MSLQHVCSQVTSQLPLYRLLQPFATSFLQAVIGISCCLFIFWQLQYRLNYKILRESYAKILDFCCLLLANVLSAVHLLAPLLSKF